MDKMKQILFEKDKTKINMSFVLYIPKDINNESNLILNGITPDIGTKEQLKKDEENNTKLYGTYLDSYKEALQTANNAYFSPDYKKLAVNYNNPMLIPIIPRCMALYTGYLGYDVYHENYERAIKGYKEGWSRFSEEDLHNFDNLDKQIEKMIYYAVDYINKKYNLNLDYKVIATGYSASAKMVNYFTALHPDLVKMVIAGGTTGLTIIPTKEYDYPLGFKDLKDENLESFKQIPQFYYIGMEDQIDSSRPRFEIKKNKDGNFIKDENGNVIPEIENGKIKFIKDNNGNYILKDGGYFSLEQTHIIHDKLSSDVQVRFDKVQSIYEKEGVNAIFKKYNGNHKITDNRLTGDILNFYESNIKKGITLDDFILDEFGFDNEKHILLKDNIIKSTNSELISKDIDTYIKRNNELNKQDKITNTYVVNYKDNLIGLSFVNYHPEVVRDGQTLKEEVEIGTGLLDEYRGKHLGTLLEKELSKKLLEMYPRFNEIVARIDNDNINSIKAATNAGFEHIKDDEYHFKR